jgi:predicted transcriptional regulator
MKMDALPGSDTILGLTADIVSSHVANNAVSMNDVPALIAGVYAALAGLGSAAVEEKAEAPTPAVSVRSSIKPDYLVSLEDGSRHKLLKRHLQGLNMTPDQYRAKWGLPAGYPMVAPNYSKSRSELAKLIGLGRKKAGPRLVSTAGR